MSPIIKDGETVFKYPCFDSILRDSWLFKCSRGTWTCLLRILWKLPRNIFETDRTSILRVVGVVVRQIQKELLSVLHRGLQTRRKVHLGWSFYLVLCSCCVLHCQTCVPSNWRDKQQRQMAQPKTIIKNSHCGVLYSYSHKWAFGKTYFSWDPAHC